MRRRVNSIIVISLLSFFVSCTGTPLIIEQESPAAAERQQDESSEVMHSRDTPLIDDNKLLFTVENDLEIRVSEMNNIAFGFVHTGKISPGGDVQLLTEELDHGFQNLSFRTYHGTYDLDNLLISPQSYTWSPSGKYVVIHNIDYYADDGSTGIVLLNVQSGHYIEITKKQIINGKNLGRREKLNIYNIVWLDSENFSLIASAAYLGESGHPGIDANRKAELGKDFGNNDDIILAASWQIQIVNDVSKRLYPEKIEKSETLKLLLGKWQSMDDTDNYVTFTDKEVIFSYKNDITHQESYILSDRCSLSLQANEDKASDTQKYIYLESSNQCFYIIDLGSQFLSLSYMDRGNTLMYVK